MWDAKCRLCLCLVDKQTGFSCSLKDNAFRTMIKTVFPFLVLESHTVDNKAYDLPVLVCYICATTVHKFYRFSRLVETNQNTLQTKCSGKNVRSSFEELVHYIKADPGVETEASDDNNPESSMMYSDTDRRGNENELNRLAMETLENGSVTPLSLHNHITDHAYMRKPQSDEPPSCVDKEEVVKSIAKMEKRVGLVTAKLNKLLGNMHRTKMKRNQSRNVTLEFSPITQEEELISLNNRLAENDFFEQFLDWLDANIGSIESENRMHETIDLLFSKTFMPKCSWTGAGQEGPKVALGSYENVMKVFELIGCTQIHRIDDHYVRRFLTRKLKNAKLRVNLKSSSRTRCRLRYRPE
ncbi:uncharacterized protein LOC131262130 [Anopheles coustani]|uniref:uncharacterized protein LOC131262130 n=1 Tax=Anopheles coustani TaxID=139045 RepID=UPI00265AD380|nr:uncharacterized protein LOC131262130 [Anopheles coustani]